MKILLTDWATVTHENDLTTDCFGRLGELACFDGITREELLREVQDTDILLCNKTVIDKAVIDSAPKLRYIGLFATGYNNIDTVYARQKGITVCNAGSYSTSAVAQQVFAYILSHYSSVGRYDRLVKDGGWISSPQFSVLCYPTDELEGKTIGIIGYGSIGKRVADIARAFNMNVLVSTRTVRPDGEINFVSLDTLLEKSDIVTVHCPLNEQSTDIFNKTAFAKMKDGAFFINTSRGGVVVEEDLLSALQSEKLSGAAVDVLKTEPMSRDCVLINAPNIIITPHTAWAPLATRKRLLSIVYDNIDMYLKGTPKNVVN